MFVVPKTEDWDRELFHIPNTENWDTVVPQTEDWEEEIRQYEAGMFVDNLFYSTFFGFKIVNYLLCYDIVLHCLLVYFQCKSRQSLMRFLTSCGWTTTFARIFAGYAKI